MEITNAEFCAGNVHGKEDLAAAGEILDVAVSAVFGAAGDRARAFLADFFFQIAGCGAGVDVLGLRWLGDDALEFCGGDELGFALVPVGEDVSARSTA